MKDRIEIFYLLIVSVLMLSLLLSFGQYLSVYIGAIAIIFCFGVHLYYQSKREAQLLEYINQLNTTRGILINQVLGQSVENLKLQAQITLLKND